MSKPESLDCWAVVELMGHQRIAGRVTERSVAGVQMLQVTVPAMGNLPEFTRMVSGNAIYAINPCDEAMATEWAKSIATSASPIISYESKHLVDKLVEKQLAGMLPGVLESTDEDHDERDTE